MFPELGALPPEVQQQIAQLEADCRQQVEQLQQTVTVEKVEALLRDQRMRPFALEIETDSTIEPDQMAEKQNRNEFMQAVGPTLQQAVEAMTIAPQLGPFVAEALRFVASGYKVPRSMDDAIDQLADGFANFQPPADNGEDPALAQMKVEAERIKAEAAKSKGEADIQIAQLKLQSEQMKAQLSQLDAALKDADVKKTHAETEKIYHDMGVEEQQLALDAQGQQMDAQGQAEDRQMQREGMAHDAEMQSRQFDADQQQADRQFKADEKQRAADGKRADAEMKMKAQAPKEQK